MLEGKGSSYIPLPVRGLAYYRVDTANGYEDLYRHLTGQPRHEKPELGKLNALPAIVPQSYPASMIVRSRQKAPTSLDQRNRLQMLKRVRLDWIDGVLEQSLYKIARIEFSLEAKTEEVEQPLQSIIQVPDRSPTVVPPGSSISRIFDDQAGALLILGPPGAGKTTLLLELARELLDRAAQNASDPIPAVFNLSSWAARRQSLTRWMVAELNERSDVPKKVAKGWLDTEQILPLLDGLDEVAMDHRQACAEAINDFRRDHGLLPIAVCSRIADYEALGTKLRLRNAVVVQPLTTIQVKEYVKRVGEPLRSLRAALAKDASFCQLLETPLMLWVAMLAYRDVPLEFCTDASFEERRRRLFEIFVDAMFKRRSVENHYTPKQTLAWLSWLASVLTHHEQTVFYLESLGVKWLRTGTQRWISRAGIIIASGLSGAIVGGLSFGLVMGRNFRLPLGPNVVLVGGLGVSLRTGLSIGLLLGLIPGLIFTFTQPRPLAAIRIGWAGLASRLRRSALVVLLFGLTFGLSLGLVFWVAWHGGVRTAMGLTLIDAFLGVMSLVAQVGLIVGLITLLINNEVVETRITPNQGTWRSIKMAMVALLGCGLLGVVIFFLNGGLTAGPNVRAFGDLIFGLIFGLTGGMIGGGMFALRHVVLRLVLGLTGSAPLNYVRFLDSAAERLFLRKVGGGYIFVHRMLRDYFASFAEPGSSG